jgi:hypothetical protein
MACRQTACPESANLTESRLVRGSLSGHQEPAVNVDGLADYRGRAVAGEIHGQRGNFVRLETSTERGEGSFKFLEGHSLAIGVVFDAPVVHQRVNRAGTDRIHRDPLGRDFHRQRASQSQETMFACRVSCPVQTSNLAGDRGDIDDAPPTSRQHARKYGLRE